MNVPTYHNELARAIEATHGAKSVFVKTVPVKEVFQGKTAWEGDVEVFALTDHPKALLCFAWGVPNDNGKGWQVTAVLGLPPVTSPETAVKAAIAAHARGVVPQPTHKP